MYKKNSLRWHYERHHLNEEFPCNICGKGEHLITVYGHVPVVVTAPELMGTLLSTVTLMPLDATFDPIIFRLTSVVSAGISS